MLKIGIVTYYYQSCNYGGILQSYALCRCLAYNNYNAEQVCISSRISSRTFLNHLRKKKFDLKTCRNAFKKVWNSIGVRYLIRNKIRSRQNAFTKFREQIPHSFGLYDAKNIADVVPSYDVFVTGSDRVWNPTKVGHPFFLEFVEGKPKFSYAASLTTNVLNESEKAYFKETLSDYVAVSVREKGSVALLQNLSNVGVEWTVDPTLLLSQNEWDDICAERVVAKKYVFCYFLGSDVVNRRTAREFAKKKGLVIVTTPYVKNEFNCSDIFFGDVRLFDVSPEQFVSLIKHAEYVLTDSFHAVVFSTIYRKEYFAFEREELKGSGSRIESLTSLCGTEDRYCNDDAKKRTDYLCGRPLLDYESIAEKIGEMQSKSKCFLKNALILCEQKIAETQGKSESSV